LTPYLLALGFYKIIMGTIQNREDKMRTIFETAQKMKNGMIKPAKVYDGIDAFAKQLKKE